MSKAVVEEVPVIDLSGDDEAAIAQKLVAAFESIGFCTLVNHGIAPTVVEKAFAASKAFFELPLATKQQYAYQSHTSNRGFIEMGQETHEAGVSSDRKETFDIGQEGETGFATPWPAELQNVNFKDDLLHYFETFNHLHLRLAKLLGIGLKIEDTDFFVKASNEQHCNLRLLHYPQLEKRKIASAVVERGALHTDFGTLTLLTQDAVGGLRVKRRDGSWVFVQPVADSIVVNVGDMMQRFTNDKLSATPHQVVEQLASSSDNDNNNQDIIPERYSIAFFCNANKNVMVEPLPSLLPADATPAKYQPIRSHEYLTQRLDATIAKS